MKALTKAESRTQPKRSTRKSTKDGTKAVDLTEFKAKPKKTLQPSSSAPREEITKPESPTKKPDRSKRKHIPVDPETVPNKTAKAMPENWELVLDNIREMRKKFDAPVDSMGCHKCSDENASPEVMRYQSLLSLMLSSQTKDQVTHAAMMRLREHGCTVDNILATTDEQLGKLIIPVGFWKSKVKYIKRTTEILKEQYNNDIPNTVEDLCKLPGVGPKMAHICMKTAWGETTGIGVDTHVHRISNRLGWVSSKTPEETRKSLEEWLPYNLWSEVNHLLVGFGQQTCLPTKPQCVSCLNKEVCPFGQNINGKK
ncbi:endonuclease III-like protein 1 [Anthonomus grandis grandis]|uniref:endonuclease III-like protein 1 n=1 Tax=Anthonomus grandis grandis TaxID=2921223 RepID=UPI002166A60E|nr:endonuclease III-like protein 1 [Anthonomus grandis grandis]